MSFLSKLSVPRRLIGGFAAVALLLCAVSAVAFTSMRSMTSASDRLSEEAVPALEQVSVLQGSTQLVSGVVTRHLYVNDGDATTQRELDKYIATELGRAREALTELQALDLGPEAEAATTATAATFADFAAAVERAQKLSLAETLRGAEDRSASRAVFDGPLTTSLTTIVGNLTDVSSSVNGAAEADGHAAASAGTRGVTVLVAGSLLAVALAGLLGLLITRSVVRPLARLEEATATAAEGDLTVQIGSTAGDELGRVSRAFDGMVGSLRSIVTAIADTARTQTAISGELAAGASQAGVAAGEIAGTVSSVATGASSQAEAAQSATDTVLDMARGVDEVARIGRSAAAAAGEADGAAADGEETVREAVAAMRSIEQVVGEVSTAVEGLGDRSRAIGQIVETISGIADQTNLLALNAAIEAARAGEQGRGFAVVADEVRKLAESSRDSASSIAGIVAEIQGDTDRAVATMTSGRGEVDGGAARVTAAGEAFARIREQVGRLGEEVAQVTGAAEALEAGAGSVREQVTEVARVSEENAAAAEEVSAATEQTSASAQQVAASAERLAEGARSLSELVARFRV